jgi:hypothetical protein
MEAGYCNRKKTDICEGVCDNEVSPLRLRPDLSVAFPSRTRVLPPAADRLPGPRGGSRGRGGACLFLFSVLLKRVFFFARPETARSKALIAPTIARVQWSFKFQIGCRRDFPSLGIAGAR